MPPLGLLQHCFVRSESSRTSRQHSPCALQGLGCGNVTRRFQHVAGDVSFLMLRSFYRSTASQASFRHASSVS
jgi:hypothetical protein